MKWRNIALLALGVVATGWVSAVRPFPRDRVSSSTSWRSRIHWVFRGLEIQPRRKVAVRSAAGGCRQVLAGIQFGPSPSSVTAAPRALSKVHILQFSSSAEASKCMSIHPRPRPASFRSPMKFKTSSCSASCTSGKARNRPNNSSRLRSVPQANSPITKRWQQTPP